MKKKNAKFNLIKKTAIIGTVGLAVALTSFDETEAYEEYQVTAQDLKDNEIFLSELKTINETSPVFQNEELYNEICNFLNKKYLTYDDLNTIHYINIKNTLDNNDFSDLKYIPNLKYIAISDNTIDLQDLEYNIELRSISLHKCEITNTSSLPNSIKNMCISNSTILDSNLSIPYYTNTLSLFYSSYNNISFKNPGILKKLTIVGDTFLDLKRLKDCINLSELKLQHISNVTNTEILKELNVDKLYLDDFAPIWLDTESLMELTNINYSNLIEESRKLDNIANSIVPENAKDEEKIKAITLYVIEHLEYDQEVANETDNKEYLSSQYNEYPIKYALTEKGICINYASLFQALANRLGIKSYQLYSKTHGWNTYFIDGTEYNIDTTFLDNNSSYLIYENGYVNVERDFLPIDERLKNSELQNYYYYSFDRNVEEELGFDTHQPLSYPTISVPSNKMGYIPKNSFLDEIIITIHDKKYKSDTLLLSLKVMIAMLATHMTMTFRSIVDEELEYEKKKNYHEEALRLRNKKIK